MSSEQTLSDDEILQTIESRFIELYQLHGEPPTRTIEKVYQDPQIIHEDFNKYGYGVINDAIREDIFRENQNNLIKELSLQIFQTSDPFDHPDFNIEYKRIDKKYPTFTNEEKVLATLTCWWNSSYGFGNSSFRFIYYQFLEKNPQFKIGEESIEFSRNPIHRHILSLMKEHPKLWSILKTFHNEQPMISWDSQKVRFQDVGRPLSKKYKSTKPVLTVPHRDVYLNDGVLIDRKQAMLIKQDTNAIALGWVLFSHDDVIQKLSSLLLNKRLDGFSTINNERLINIMNRYWRAPLTGFIVWRQETVHYEGVPNSDRSLSSLSQPLENLSLFSFRIVMGTHEPIGLTEEMRKQLAFLAENGWCPEIYIRNRPHNKGTMVNLNVVNRKTTQFNISRKLTSVERESLDSLVDTYTKEYIEEFVNGLPKIIKEFYGLY